MKLNRLLLFITMMAVAISCDRNIGEFDQVTLPTINSELKAVLPTRTRIAFENNLGDDCLGTIDLSWEDDDTFTVSGGSLTSDVIFSYDNQTDTFTSEASLKNGEEYTATYGKAVSLFTQVGSDSVEHLDDIIKLQATFKYGEDEVLNFAHTQSFLCLVVDSGFTPKLLTYSDGTTELSAEITDGVKGVNNIYIPISPVSGERTINIEVTDSDAVKHTFSKRVSAAYEVGKVYKGVVTFIKEVAELTINVTEIAIPALGGEVIVDVTYTGDGYWQVEKSGWSLYYDILSGDNDGAYTPKFTGNAQLKFYRDSENDSMEVSELSTVKFSVDGKVVITIKAFQEAAEPYIALSQNIFDVPCQGGKFYFDLMCLDDDYDEWKSADATSTNWGYCNGSWGYGPSDSPIMLTVLENESEAPRTTTITFYLIKDPAIKATLTINQAGYVYVPPTDIEILQDCYTTSTEGLSYSDKWEKSTGWSSDYWTQLSQLFGVTPSADGEYVLKIELPNNDISQSVVLSNLHYLEELNLLGNDIESLDISSCENLRKLNVYNNKLTLLNIEGCIAIEELNLGNSWSYAARNNFSSFDFSALAELTTLSLSYHDIEELDLSKNKKLTSLDVENCEKLKIIKLAGDTLPDIFKCTGWGEQNPELYEVPNHIDGYQYPAIELSESGGGSIRF